MSIPNLKFDRPQSIRVLMVAPEGAAVQQTMVDYFRQADRFPIVLVDVTNSPERCRSLVRELFPQVVLLLDVAQDGANDWSLQLRQLSEDFNRDYTGIATVLLTDSKPETMPAYYERALQAGARGVVNIGRLGDGMVAAFGEIERAILRAHSFVRQSATGFGSALPSETLKLITVTSGKGGVGKSTIASSLACELARSRIGKRVVLVDFDVQYGALATMLGIMPRNSIAQFADSNTDLELVRTAEDMLQFVELLPVGDGATLHVMVAPASPAELSVIPSDRAAQILSTLKRIFDYVVLDLPTQISDASLVAYQITDLLLLVCEPEVLSVRTGKQLLQLLQDPVYGNALLTPRVVLNKVWGKREIKVWGEPLVDAKVAESSFPGRVIARFPLDAAFINEHINRGKPIGALEISSSFLHELRRLVQALEPEWKPTGLARPTHQSRGPLTGLLRLFQS